MATFPALQPTARTYIPGQSPATPIGSLDGGELSVRHINSSVGYTLRLGFTGLTDTEHFSIISHYMIHGRFQPFDLPPSIVAGANFEFPSGYSWIYVSSPDTEYAPGLINVTVELELIPANPFLSSPDSILQCPAGQQSGGQGTFIQTFDIGPGTGTFDFTYSAFTIADKFTITGAAYYNSGYVTGTNVVVPITKINTGRYVIVQVNAPDSGTQWEYTVGCTY